MSSMKSKFEVSLGRLKCEVRMLKWDVGKWEVWKWEVGKSEVGSRKTEVGSRKSAFVEMYYIAEDMK